jgi:hypothetical protein
MSQLRRIGDTRFGRYLDPRLSLGGILNTIGIIALGVWGYFSGVSEALQENRREIGRIGGIQRQVVETQGRVVEALADIKVLLAGMREKDDNLSRRLDRVEDALDTMRGSPRITPR